MEYFFILGRNFDLSKKEILCFLERKGIKILERKEIENFVLLDLEKDLEEEDINFLGGVIGIGKVLFKGELQEIFDKISFEDFFSVRKNKLNYVMYNSESKIYNEISEALKQRFKQEKIKATHKKLTGFMKTQDEKRIRKLRSEHIDEKFFVFDFEEKSFFGKIIQECDYQSLEKRDMGKPFRREELAISPRLAKAMINFSLIDFNNKNERLLDCFCGIGVILFEALLQGHKVTGIDKDKEAISGCRQNLSWGRFNQKDYDIINNDSTKVRIKEQEVLVTEPDFGQTLKKIPPREKIDKQLRDFEDLIINVLKNLSGKIKKRIVITSPFILTHKKQTRKGIKVEKILEQTGLKLVEGFPIDDFRAGQIVGRQIFVFEK
jgi:tRNA G10  N-methylase Trm11